MERDASHLGHGKIVADYPSGKRVEENGNLHFTQLPNTEEAAPIVIPDENKEAVLVLDPRALITVDGVIRYHPRAFGAHLAEWVRQWLAEHPDWAPVASFEGTAPGAWAKGTRIRKKVFEKGDGHQVGDMGRVLGSVLNQQGAIIYSIGWDDNPSVPVACQAYKIEKA